MKKIYVMILTAVLMVMAYGDNLKTYDGKYFTMQYPEGMNVAELEEGVVFLRFDGDKETTVSFYISGSVPKTDKEFFDMIRQEVEKNKNESQIKFELFNMVVDERPAVRYECERQKSRYINAGAYNYNFMNIYSRIPLWADNFTEKYEKILDIIKSVKFKDIKYSEWKIGTQNRLTQKEVIEDLEDLMKKMKVHPDLYKFRNRETTEKEYAEIERTIKTKESWESIEIYKLFAPFVSGIKDVHTNLFTGDFFRRDKIFPLSLNIRNGKAVISNKKNKELLGKEIISINGYLIREIIEKANPFLSADEGCESIKEEVIGSYIGGYYYLLYGAADKFIIEYIDENRTIKTTELNSGFIYEPNDRTSETVLEFPRNDTALIKINILMGNNQLYKRRIADSLKILNKRKSKNLIIDNRKNPGGSPELTEFIYDFINPKSNNPDRFKGNVYVLSDRSTVSAGTFLIGLTKFGDKSIQIVGNPTGGRLNTFVNPNGTRLKNSKLGIMISTEYVPMNKLINGMNEEYGAVEPDVYVEIDPAKEVLGEDQVMKKVFEMIGEEKKVTWDIDEAWEYKNNELLFKLNKGDDTVAWNTDILVNNNVAVEFDAEFETNSENELYEMIIILYGNGLKGREEQWKQGVIINYNAFKNNAWIRINDIYEGGELIAANEKIPFISGNKSRHYLITFKDGSLTFKVDKTTLFDNVPVEFVSKNGYIGIANYFENNVKFKITNLKINKE